ncbi:sulfurtransferase complex subunit TusC [Microbulbifer sp. THAF38]|uniref:sulfurtransferase complex subunit TusC n=1 Tax=Microbulbifer sp. THAF38 TaxID=2587856 RepID=UPI001267B3EC|nr:sulfurtransferase complex subunit TusC [Microbulbifer sp. THAF38]QFT54669.1 Intracellular sulfur oxidation protein DsrF [Microbulbifer sp. THAF38]
MSNQTLALCRAAPYGSALAREGIEAVLASAAMEQEIDLLFLGDGIFQLLDNQAPEAIEQKSLRRNLMALPMFGVEQLYVCQRSLEERGIGPDLIQIPGAEVTLVGNPGELIAPYQCVLSF